jgi:hypothetical protein
LNSLSSLESKAGTLELRLSMESSFGWVIVHLVLLADHQGVKAAVVLKICSPLSANIPTRGKSWGWQWVFPATSHYTDKVTGERRRHHLHESVLQKAVKEAVRQAGKPAHFSPFFRDSSTRRRL